MKKLLIFVSMLGFFAAAPAYAVDVKEVVGPKTGIKAWLVEDHKLPIVAMSFAFQGGSEQDPADKQGLAALTMGLMTAGAGNLDAVAFQKQLADRSIKLGFAAARDSLNGSLKCLSADKQKAFDLLRLAVASPRFDDADIERLRAQQFSGIKHQFADPEWQARYALLSQIYAGHPYGQRYLGTLQTLQSINKSDIKSFAAHHLAKDTITVAVAGDMTAKELAAAVDKVFADIPAHAQLSSVADVNEITDTSSTIVKRDGAQTEILFAMLGPKRNDPDYYAAEIINYVLGGGGFSSRLMQDIRDKKGLTYGISTDLSPSQHSALIIGRAAVDNQKSAEALAAIKETMHDFYDESPSEREISSAKDYLTGSEPLALTSVSGIASILVMMQQENLGRDYLDRYGELIRSVTRADINRVLERWFNPDKFVYVLVGKPEGVAAAQIKDTVKQ